MDIRSFLTHIMPDALYIQLVYLKHFGKFADLKNPKSFNEKLQWLKLHERNKEYSTLVDKYRVKKYVADIIGEEYIIPTLGVWKYPKDIEFDKLPNQFVLKWNHDSGSVIICKDKNTFNATAAVKKLSKRINYNGFNFGREWPYKYVKPCIIAEQYLNDKTDDSNNEDSIYDYKFFCFNGKVKFYKIDFDRFIDHHANYYSPKGKLLPFGESALPPKPEKKLDIPRNINKMIILAEKLSKNYPFVRIDFYNVCGHIYFGEITFYPGSGFSKITPESYDVKIGSLIDLSHMKK
jgi:hypothetical protein